MTWAFARASPLGALDEEITLELSDYVDDIHGHLSSGADETDAAQGEAMDADAHLLQFGDGGADINGVASKPLEFGYDQHIPLFYPVDEP